jgi:uncharacterized protein (DUF2252 family)
MAKSVSATTRQILRYNAGRDPQRVLLKYRAMRDNAFAFLRGTCHLFYRGLPRDKVLVRAPLAWSCGDLHLQNFGSYKGDNRLAYFDLNDFDEAALAPCSWDLLRLLVSVQVAADVLNLRAARAGKLCRACLRAYADVITDGKARWIEQETAQGLVGALLKRLRKRTRRALLARRTTLRASGGRRLRIDGRHALPASAQARARVRQLVAAVARKQKRTRFLRVLDVARRIAGTGSLGVERYVVLVEGKGSPDGNYLLDLKQARPSALCTQLAAPQPKWKSEAHRVIAVQQRMQAIPMAFLTPVRRGKQSYVLRELQPAEDRVELAAAALDRAALEELIGTMGRLLAWAQLRSSGRQGAATADDLARFWERPGRLAALLALANAGREQTRREWQSYCADFDRGLVTAGLESAGPAAAPPAGLRRRARAGP